MWVFNSLAGFVEECFFWWLYEGCRGLKVKKESGQKAK